MIRSFCFFVITLLPSLALSAPAKSDLVLNILREFHAEVDIRDGGICVFRDTARPFSQRVMLDCESFLNELLLDHQSFATKPSRLLVENLLRYGEILLGSLYQNDIFILSSEKEVDAITVSRLILYVIDLSIKDEKILSPQRIIDFYVNNQLKIEPIFSSLADEETVNRLRIALEGLRSRNIIHSNSIVSEGAKMQVSDVLEVEAKNSEEASVSNSVLDKKENYAWIYMCCGLVLLSTIIVFFIKKNFRIGPEIGVGVGMSQEERAELRELRYFFGVTNTVSLQDLAKSYRAMVREVHPDSGNSDVGVFIGLQEKYARVRELQEKFLKQKLS